VDVEAAPTTGVSARPFVGRARELEELVAALEDAAACNGSLLLLTGEAGIGKTRLMQVFGALAGERGWQVLVGRCWEEGGAPAYWPWIQVVRDAGGDFERLAEPPSETGQTPGDPESVRFWLFDAATRYLVESARQRPVLVVLDDLHAADAPSLVLLRFLGEAISQTRMLVVGSYRSGDSRVHELAEQFAGLSRVGRRLSLRGLSADEVEAYVESVSGREASRAVAERLHTITGGNPFFLGELVRTFAVDGSLDETAEAARDPILRVPEEVRVLIRRRVAGLSREAIAVLHVATVIGREFELGILERTSRLSTERLLDVLAEAADAGVVLAHSAGARFSFAHELVRETLYEDLAASRRLELHLQIGRTLEELGRGDPDARLSEIAHHLALAAPLGDVDEAVNYLVRAGERASALLAYEEAAADFERALQLHRADNLPAERRGELLLRLGDAQWRAGDTRAASANFEEAAHLARSLGAAELLARAALSYVTGLGGFLLFARFAAGATGIGLLEEAQAALPAADSPLRARVLARLAVELYSSQEVERRVALSREAIEMARRLGDAEALATALHARHWALCAPEMVRDRLANSEQMLDVAALTGNLETAFLAHNNRLHAFLELCDGPGVDAEIEAMANLSERMHQPFYRWHALCIQAVRATLDGRFEDAKRRAHEARSVRGLEHSGYADYVLRFAQSVAISWTEGRFDELAAAIGGHADGFPWVPRWRDALAASETGDVGAARAEIERHARRDFADLPRDGLWILHLCSLSQACVLVGDSRRGEQLYELLLPFEDRNAVSYTLQSLGPVALRLGMLATMLERWDAAEAHFEAGLERCAVLGARSLRARTLLAYAEMLRAHGKAADALRIRAMQDEAAVLSEELGLAQPERQPPAAAVEAVFRREGDLWTIRYSGEVFRLRDVKGLGYLARLLGSPGEEIHVLELAGAGEAAGVGRGTDQPLLDARARNEYRTRLQDLGADLEQARGWRDIERVACIEAEIDALTNELAHATGLGGRDRGLPSPAERARVSVTKATRSAIRGIERHDPELGAHLDASVKTGRFCSYAPPGEAPPRWSL